MESFKLFKKLYKEALEKNRDCFYYKGKEVSTSFAKYVIEYVQSKIDSGELKPNTNEDIIN